MLKSIRRALLLLTVLCSCSQNRGEGFDNSTVDSFDPDRYLGTWYEIARFPHSFEKNLVGVTATYSLRDDGKIKVVNKGFKNSFSGESRTSVGKAKPAKSGNPAHLRVSFFLFFYADYKVMELDEENYQWAIVGSSSPDYLWILCRKPQMDEALYSKLVSLAATRGYDTSRLERVPQKEEEEE